jgi:hypothetical protein
MCYDNTKHKVIEGEVCIGETIGGNIGSIVEPNT